MRSSSNNSLLSNLSSRGHNNAFHSHRRRRRHQPPITLELLRHLLIVHPHLPVARKERRRLSATLLTKHWTDVVQDVLGRQLKARRRHSHLPSGITETPVGTALMLLLSGWGRQGFVSIRRCRDRFYLQQSNVSVPRTRQLGANKIMDENE